MTGLSLPLSEETLPQRASLEALFYGLGSDGSVSATKNNIKIIGNSTSMYAQGYFVYDSKKAGGLTVSHLRVSEQPINSAYLVSRADFVGCHQLQFIDTYQMAERLKPGGIFLLNTPMVPKRPGRGCRRKCKPSCSNVRHASISSTRRNWRVNAGSVHVSTP